ncbi:hypothetical protein LC613_18805 [Nostoc sphaeroides CHAB 2801]|uniref:hypothetical protein n=1 Tax=Nostoc sphaeroides TaxID=446679 RepID=UPI0015F312EE|nr:hypothetical protein [Nostoc sphaeroides]MCC5629979.1 hypothetical protein [Nostoc sphaeroides CHAB 2801]
MEYFFTWKSLNKQNSGVSRQNGLNLSYPLTELNSERKQSFERLPRSQPLAGNARP